jgi:hypothetical protein
MISRVFNAKDGGLMSVWCCAAIILSGDAPPELPALAPEPLLQAKPLRVQSAPCTDCGGKVLPRPPATPRQPIARQALPPLVAPEGSVPLRASAQTPNTFAMPTADGHHSFPLQAPYGMPPVVYGGGLDPNSVNSAPTRRPWWKRIFGREVEAPSWQMTNNSPPAMIPSTPMPATAGRALQRQTWRTQEPSPTMMAHRPAELTVQPTVRPAVEPAPTKPVVQTVHTVRKPASAPSSMVRDASVWEYRKPWPTSDRAAAVPAKPAPAKPVEPMAAAETSEPVAEVPAAQPKEAWAEEVVRKTLEYSDAKGRVAEKAPDLTKRISETISGRVSWSESGGGCWVLNASGKEYVLKGDPSLLRLQVGDEVEVKGVVKRGEASGATTMTVEKLSLSAKR